ncbi:hypothetical protein Tco_1083770 [Tanacetum coccineum]
MKREGIKSNDLYELCRNLRIAAGTVKCQDARHIAKKAVDVTYIDERVSARLMQKEWLLSTRSKMECKISLIVVSRWRRREVVPPETTFRPGYRNILLEASKCNSSFFFGLEIRTPSHEVLDIVAQTFVAAIATHKNETPGSQPSSEKQTTSKDNCYHNPHLQPRKRKKTEMELMMQRLKIKKEKKQRKEGGLSIRQSVNII